MCTSESVVLKSIKHLSDNFDLVQYHESKNLQHSGYKVSVIPKDAEAGKQNGDAKWDPFAHRSVPNPTTDCDTLTHLLKASLGTGILAMPVAFKNAGIGVGIFSTVLVAFMCTYCAYILVKSAHILYHRTRSTTMSFADVAEVSFANGPKPVRKFAKFARMLVLWGLFLTYFGTCSVYTVIIGANFSQVIDYHTGQTLDQRWIIGGLLIPLILLSWVPDLKKLAPVSMVANLFMGVGLGITFYYLVWDLPELSTLPVTAPIQDLPVFFSITIFAMEAIGVVMPLENSMKTPTHFLGICGVLNQGMAGVTLVYIFLGFLGFWKYGDDCKGSITLNLPIEDYAAQAVKILIGLAVYCTYGLQFFVCLEIGWNGVKEKCQKNPRLYEYGLRTILVTLSVLLAILVPTISPFIGLIGAFCFSILGLIVPCVIECITLWETGLGKFNYILWKNIVIGFFGVLALVFGTYTSILDIAAIYAPSNATSVLNETIAEATTIVLDQISSR